MASTSTSAAIVMDPSTVAAQPRWSYDAFLSFRGEDTRNNFVSHLLASLSRKGIHTFFDDKELERGEEIKPALLKAIEESQIEVVIFSENYASSTWCLEELSKIIWCIESGRGQTLVPVFYKVDPSVVRKQPSGSAFHAALEKHEERNQDKVQKWREVLQKASDISGEHFDNGSEADFVEKIARLVSERIGRRQLMDVAKNPVGLDFEIENVKPLLRIGELGKTCFIGIVGAGGMGKTTLAKAIYNQFAKYFDGCSFLANVREMSQQTDGLIKLQNRLLSGCLTGEEINVENEDSGIISIKHRLQNKRCLIVLDDVDHGRQMEALAGGCDWFAPGSRIIVTTRDEHVLAQVRAIKHRMDGLSKDDARELLSWSAFGEPSPPIEYEKVGSDVLNYAKGLPLALKVLGSSLYEADVSHWEDTIRKLKDIPNKEICKILQISYDGLEDDVKAIFLHIACFFKGKFKDEVVDILNGCRYHSESGIRDLMQRSLITSINGTLDMHDLIEEMGKNIVKQESDAPSKRSWLWLEEDIRSVLEDNTGTGAIQAIYLKNYVWQEFHIGLNPEAFKKMPNLRMLILRDCEFSCGPASLPNHELRYLIWDNYPTTSLPLDFNPRELIHLKLSNSPNITKLWDGKKMGLKLTVMDIDGCEKLSEIPDVSGMPNLKELSVESCGSLVTVHESVGSLGKLEILRFVRCDSLKEFPSELRLPSLQYLCLEGCENLEKFPDISERMKHLETLELSYTNIKELPPSIENLTELQKLDLSGCVRLRGFLNKQPELEEDDDSFFLSNLSELNLSESNIISLSPCITKYYSLKRLDLSYSERLKEIPELPPRLEYLDARGCESLETIGTQSLRAMGKIIIDFGSCYNLRGREEMGSEMLTEWLKGHEERMKRSSPELLEDYAEDHDFEVLIPGEDIPVWDYHGRSGVGKYCLNFKVHSRVLKELAGYALFAAISDIRGECTWLLKVNGVTVHERKRLLHSYGDEAWIIYNNLERHWEEKILLPSNGWNYFSFQAKFDRGFLKSSGVSFIGKSGEVFNSSTDIKFLGSETTDDEETVEDIAEATAGDEDEDEDEDRAEASTDDSLAYDQYKAREVAMADYEDIEDDIGQAMKKMEMDPEASKIVIPDKLNDSHGNVLNGMQQRIKESYAIDREIHRTYISLAQGQAMKKMKMDPEASKIVIPDKLNDSRRNVLIGMQQRIKELSKELDVESKGAVFVGIHGIGGIGKTTLAKAVFDQLCTQFEGYSLLSDIRETSKHEGLKYLLDKLLTDIEGGAADLDTSTKRPDFLMKKVLIVLDDVDDREQIAKLVGMPNRFVSGSRIIITTRDINVLAVERETLHGSVLEWPEGIRKIKMEEMGKKEALQLFCGHAFGEVRPHNGYRSLCEQVISKTGRHPFALEIIGSFLRCKPQNAWEETLEELGTSDRDLRKMLMISYKKLELETKEIFLDIACFFTGSKKHAPMYMWDACKLGPEQRIEELISLSFVKVLDDNRLWMHDEVRDFGRKIACGETITDPDEGIRFWVNTDVLSILRSTEENKNVRGLRLCYDDFLPNCTLPPGDLGSLPNLRFLELSGLSSAVKRDLPELRWLSLHHSLEDVAATDVFLEKLVILDLSNSSINNQWVESGKLGVAKNLKVLNLTSCKMITKSPVFFEDMIVERLILEDCASLVEIDRSIGKLKQLMYLNLKGCNSLEELPDELGSARALTELVLKGNGQSFKLNQSLVGLASLSVMEIYNVKIVDNLTIGNSEKLELLTIAKCAGINELPRSISHFTSLVKLDISASELSRLPDSIGEMKLKELHAKRCENLQGEIPSEIGRLSSLSILDLSFTGISSLPSTLSQLVNLQTLNLESCHELVELPNLPTSLVSLHVMSKKLQILPDLSKMNRLIDLQLLGPVENFQADWIEKLSGLEKLELLVPRLTSLGFSEASQLRSLSLSCREIDTLPQLPSSLSRLSLAHLKKNTTFTGLSNLERLAFLEFYRCSLGVNQCRTLKAELKSLEHLSATKCLISSINEKKRPRRTAGLPLSEGLRVLSMKKSELPGKVIDLSRVRNLLHLELIDCQLLIEIRGLEELKSLERATICDCSSLKRMGDVSNLESLQILQIDNCMKLEEVRGLERIKSLKRLEIYGCKSLKSSLANVYL